MERAILAPSPRWRDAKIHWAGRYSMKHLVKGVAHAIGYDFVEYDGHTTLAAHLRTLFSALGVDLVLDVGAHHGEYGRLLRNQVR